MESIFDYRREHTNLWLYAMGKGVSILGSSVYSFAIGLYVLVLTGSALNYAATIMLSVIPMVLISPIAGVFADRLPKKLVVVSMDLANGLLFLVLYGLSAAKPLTLGVIYTSTVLLNVFTTFFGISMEAAKPSLVSKGKLIKLNALGKLIDSSASIVGPMLGGIVFALVDIRSFILFNGISFIFSAFTECFIDYTYNRDDRLEAVDLTQRTINKGSVLGGLKRDFIEGWQTFKGSKRILELFIIFVSLNFVFGFSVNVPGPFMINTILKLPARFFGFINGLFPLGLVIGTLSVERVMKHVDYKKLLTLMNALIAALAMCIGLPVLTLRFLFPMMVYTFYYGVLYFLMGVAVAYVDVPIMTLLQTEISSAHLGRVLSIIMSLVKIVLPVALIASGFLIGILPIVLIPILGGLFPLVYSIFKLLSKQSASI